MDGLPILRHLRQLSCTTREPLDLAFVRGLSSLEKLVVSPARDLSGLLGCNISELELHTRSGQLVSLGPLRPLSALRRLRVRGQATDLRAITALRELEDLSLGALSLTALKVLSSLSGLKSLELSGVALRDLSPIAFLRAPSTLAIVESPEALDVAGLKAWARSLRTLTLVGKVRDLAPLGQLSNLHSLTLTRGLRLADTSLLASMGSLAEFTTADHIDWSTVPLPASLSRLQLGSSHVSLKGLRCENPLTVVIDEAATMDKESKKLGPNIVIKRVRLSDVWLSRQQ